MNGDEILASGLYFRWGPILVKYMQGWALQYRKLSPGTVLDIEMIRYGLALGVRVIDFGRGDEKYKARFNARTQWLYNYVFSPLGST